MLFGFFVVIKRIKNSFFLFFFFFPPDFFPPLGRIADCLVEYVCANINVSVSCRKGEKG